MQLAALVVSFSLVYSSSIWIFCDFCDEADVGGDSNISDAVFRDVQNIVADNKWKTRIVWRAQHSVDTVTGARECQ